jgi:hypothetical protein
LREAFRAGLVATDPAATGPAASDFFAAFFATRFAVINEIVSVSGHAPPDPEI